MSGTEVVRVSNRSNYWDNIKGILIFLVVFGHVLLEQSADQGTAKTVLLCIYLFHMPAFVFVSGYFGKSERSRSFEAILKLVFLYFVFNTLMGFWKGFGNPMFLTPLYSYWYLLAIIFWRLTAHRLAIVKEIRVILFAIAIFVGYYSGINNVLALTRILAFFPFYMAGYRLTRENVDVIRNWSWKKKLCVGSGAVALASVIAWLSLRFLVVKLVTCEMFSYSERIEAFSRIAIFFTSALVIVAFLCFSVERKIPLLTVIGRNSLWIYLLHRPVTMLLSTAFCSGTTATVLLGAIGLSLLIVVLFGNSLIARPLNALAEQGSKLLTTDTSRKPIAAQVVALSIALGLVVKIVIGAYAGVSWEDMKALLKGEQAPTTGDYESGDAPMYAAMSVDQKKAFDEAFRITFAGDLLLLEDQVKRGWTGNGYDFSDVFEYAKPYIESADYAIGVFEGPMAGKKAGYSSSNYDDGKELWLNFPDEFATSVKNTGFDLVTTANNHLLDRGLDGAIRTLDVLDEIGLDHTGSYRNEEEKRNNRVKIVTVEGVRMAILSYTYGTNIDNQKLTEGAWSFLSSVASGTSGETFEKQKDQVRKDFLEAKALEPDLIIVLPHWGEQFDNQINREQDVWCNIYKELGADIILGDHAHVVQPVVIENYGGRDIFCAYCPGNFANIYREKQGDTSMLVDVYIDRTTKKIIGGSIVPLYTQATLTGNYRALPVHEIVCNDSLRAQLSTDDYLRANSSIATITRVVFKESMDIFSATKRYFFDKQKFIRSKTTGLELTDELRRGVLFGELEKAQTICFVGDSVTEGTRNGGCPWYEPIEEYLNYKTVLNYSKGGCTVSYMIEHAKEIPVAELYVIALGTNDVRYRDNKLCAMTKEAFVEAIEKLRKILAEKSPNARFVFVAPWYSTDGDPYCAMKYAEKTNMNEEYSKALEEYCKNSAYTYVNANMYIRECLEEAPVKEFLVDHIHPNAARGVVLYSEAALAWKTNGK